MERAGKRTSTMPHEPVDCGSLEKISRVGGARGFIGLFELQTDRYWIEVTLDPKRRIEIGGQVEYQPDVSLVVVTSKDGRKVQRFLCTYRRRYRLRRGEWMQWVKGQWYSACAGWARAMRLEAFLATMEHHAAHEGTGRNLRAR